MDVLHEWSTGDGVEGHAHCPSGAELKSWESEQARFDNCMLELEELSLSQFCNANEAENLQRLELEIADFQKTSLKRKFNSHDDASGEVHEHVQENIEYTRMWESYTHAIEERSQQFYLQLKQNALHAQKLQWQTKNRQLHQALREILDWQCIALQESMAKKCLCCDMQAQWTQNIHKIGDLAAKRIRDQEHAVTDWRSDR